MPPAQASKKEELHRLVAERFRSERIIERYGQAELARELGVNRSAISNYEYLAAPVSFAAGLEFCRRLDLNPRWLATGEEPKRPFVDPAELGIEARALRVHMRRGGDFLTGYEAALAKPIAEWVKRAPIVQLVRREVETGPEAHSRRLSIEQLEAQAAEAIAALQKEPDDLKLARLDVALAMLQELRSRLAPKYARKRGARGGE
jgi:transcriptional regulator with XRE-family HTH domain